MNAMYLRNGGREVHVGMTNFLQSLLNAQTEDGFLTFSPCYFPGNRVDLRSCLLVREAYVKAYEILTGPKVKDVCVTGSAGIGKSWFAIYAMWRKLKEAPHTVFVLDSENNTGIWYMFKDGKAYVGDCTSFEEEIDTEGTWLIAHQLSTLPTKIPAKMIFVACGGGCKKDDPSRWIIHNNARKVLLPPPELAEIRALYERQYKAIITEDRYNKLLALYGRQFRLVLENPSAKTEAEDDVAAWDALAACDVEDVLKCLRQSDGIPRHGHRLLSLFPDDDYRYTRAVTFASPQLMRMFETGLLQTQKHEMHALLGRWPRY